MGCVEVLQDPVAQGLRYNHAVLVKKDTILGVHGVADGPKTAEGSVISIKASLLSDLQQVTEGCVCGCLLCKEGPGDCS